jgi:hypothetical protein
MSYRRSQNEGMWTGNFYYPTDSSADRIEQRYNDLMHKVRFRIDRGDIHLMSFLGKAGSRGQNPPLVTNSDLFPFARCN